MDWEGVSGLGVVKSAATLLALWAVGVEPVWRPPFPMLRINNSTACFRAMRKAAKPMRMRRQRRRRRHAHLPLPLQQGGSGVHLWPPSRAGGRGVPQCRQEGENGVPLCRQEPHERQREIVGRSVQWR